MARTTLTSKLAAKATALRATEADKLAASAALITASEAAAQDSVTAGAHATAVEKALGILDAAGVAI